MRRRLHTSLVSALVLVLIASAGAAPAGAAAKKPKLFRILVSNDDGVSAPGIDAVVELLRKLPNVRVTVVAPATNQSGTGGKTTPGTLTASKTTTASGYSATAVEGTPADSVNYALDNNPVKPNLVVSGVNEGQNLGPLIDASGTVGAARAAAMRGVSALAVSSGVPKPVDFASGAKQAIEWVKSHRDGITRHPKKVVLENLNVPTCTSGVVRGLVKAPVATVAALQSADCTSTATKPTTDIEAFNEGYAVVSILTVTP
jgi:5'-nucleotidase